MPHLETRELAFYGESLLAAHVAQSLDLSFIEAPLDWLTHLPSEYVKRRIRYMTLEEARQDRSSRFIKPANDKAFPAKIYADENDFSDLESYDGGMPILESEIVPVVDEYRFFILDRGIQTGSIYCRSGRLTEEPDGGWEDDATGTSLAAEFAMQLIRDHHVFLPPAIVLDVCTTADRG